MRSRPLLPFGLGTVLLFAGTLATAQTTGDISGRVTGGDGEPLAGVKIEATSPSLPGARITQTDRDGIYRFPAVPPGDYRILASLSGFRSVEKACTVSLGSAMNVDLTLRIETEERVFVSGETPPIGTSSTTTGTSYTSDVIGRLPVIRNYADVVRADPGVGTDIGETQDRFLPLTVYGATSAENQWFIDGVNTTNVQKGIQGKALSSEFVQEVEIKTGGYQAEYGRALGGVVNAITKSGGNSFHGDAFLYYDSIDTIARQRFEEGDSEIAGMRLLDAERFDYGVDLGGYLLKDRLWFFAAYNRATLDGQLSRFESSAHVPRDARFPFEGVDNLYSGKLTWNASPSTTAVATVLGDPSETSGIAGAYPRQGLSVSATPVVSLDRSTWYSERTQGGLDYGLRLTHLFGSRALATAQGAHHEDDNSLHADEHIQYIDVTCVGGSRETRCVPPPEPNSITGGYGVINLSESSRRQYAGSFSFFARAHEVKAGADYMNGRTALLNRFTGGQIVTIANEFGETYYSHRYRADGPSATTPGEGNSRSARVIDYGAYVQDSWKVSAGLTVNAGLRWDGEQTRDYLGRTVLRFDDDWQPRLGVAWDPWRDGKSKIFAFAGRFSGALATTAATIAFAYVSAFRSFNFDSVSIVQDPNVYQHGRRTGSGSAVTTAVDEGVKNWYQDELTLGVERALAPTVTVGLKGTYRRLGRALEDRCDLDYTSAENGFAECAFINPGSNGKYARGDFVACDGFYGAPEGNQCFPTAPAAPSARRLYRGIELLLRHSVRDRLWLQGSYSHSSLRGNYDGAVNEGTYSQSLGTTTPGITYAFSFPPLWHNSYGRLALDRPNRFRFDGWWATPVRVSVGLQAFAVSGAPLNKLGYYPLPGPSVFLVTRGSAGQLPTLWDANLTLSYPISIGPVTATLQGYLYNVFNNQIVTSRDQAWTISPAAGFPDTLYDPNQEQNNPSYGRVTGRSDPRSFRAALKVAF